MHNHSPAMKLVGSISWLLTAIAAIAWGLIGLGVSMGKNWNIWESDFIVNNLQWLILPGQYVIGICGVISLVMWLACLGAGCADHTHSRK